MVLPSTLSKREASFGFGNKEITSLDQRKNAKENPSPFEYIDTEFKINKDLGQSFALGHEVYKK